MIRRFSQLIAVAAVVLFPSLALAGPLDELARELIDPESTVGYWAEAVALVSAVAALLVAVLPQGLPGGVWGRVRTLLNAFASNWGNARNEGE